MTEDQLKAILDAALARQAERLDQRFSKQAELLDERFTEQSERLDERLAKQAERLDDRFAKQSAAFEQQLAVFFGQVTKYVDKQVAELRTEVRSTHDDVNRVLGAVDALAKHQETDEQERLAMSAQLDRQKGWISQLADATNTKLVPEP